MALSEIITGSTGAILVLLTIIQIAPIKINPWTALLKWISKTTQAETIKKLDQVQADVNSIRSDLADLQEQDMKNEALNARYRIIRFADECYLGQRHSQEHFNQILNDITFYESYCANHPEFPNQVAVIAIEQIKRIYQKTIEQHDFLS